jgi:hypothetical protein
MKTYLEKYLVRVRQSATGFDPGAGHEIAGTVLSFKYGLYTNASRNAATALRVVPGSPGISGTIRKALEMVRERSDMLELADPRPELSTIFDETDRQWLCIDLPQDPNRDPFILSMDNALLLLYAVGIATSPEDQQALEENQKFALQILGDYKIPLNL